MLRKMLISLLLQLGISIITVDHMRSMKDRSIVCNIGHFDSEIQIESLRNFRWNNIKPQVDEIEFLMENYCSC